MSPQYTPPRTRATIPSDVAPLSPFGDPASSFKERLVGSTVNSAAIATASSIWANNSDLWTPGQDRMLHIVIIGILLAISAIFVARSFYKHIRRNRRQAWSSSRTIASGTSGSAEIPRFYQATISCESTVSEWSDVKPLHLSLSHPLSNGRSRLVLEHDVGADGSWRWRRPVASSSGDKSVGLSLFIAMPCPSNSRCWALRSPLLPGDTTGRPNLVGGYPNTFSASKGIKKEVPYIEFGSIKLPLSRNADIPGKTGRI
ncbi:hypothetical protein BD410DRAFT_792392 [Rickenella mellea]|uniref:Uncharacterized protein n=1 Tax=Rickenella mellea TaxID=50990 RepID=A0A4Y7PX77_9AGAM|nr:hypothetical protein BD410DRAFT_792392 [Rickenella mellea]